MVIFRVYLNFLEGTEYWILFICHLGYKQVVFLGQICGLYIISLDVDHSTGSEQFCLLGRSGEALYWAWGIRSVSSTGSRPNSLSGCGGGPVQLGRSPEIQGPFGPCSGVLQVKMTRVLITKKGGMLPNSHSSKYYVSTLPGTRVFFSKRQLVS